MSQQEAKWVWCGEAHFAKRRSPVIKKRSLRVLFNRCPSRYNEAQVISHTQPADWRRHATDHAWLKSMQGEIKPQRARCHHLQK